MSEGDRMDRRQFAGKLAAGSGAVAALVASQSNCAGDDPLPAKPGDQDKSKPEDAEAPVVEPPIESHFCCRI